MHLILTENEAIDAESSFNKFENIFCKMESLEKRRFVEKWKSISSRSEFRFNVGRVFTNNEGSVIKRLQAYNLTGTGCSKNPNDNKTHLLMACNTKENITILLEFILLKTNYLYVEVRYKSESLQREGDLEKFLTLVLSDVGQNENEEIIGR
jgi:hypothetical protein